MFPLYNKFRESAGISRYRFESTKAYDDDYRQFINLVTQQVTTPQLSAVILREEVERRAALARQEALDRDRLSKELSEAETKFARFATRAPIGLAILGVDGLAYLPM